MEMLLIGDQMEQHLCRKGCWMLFLPMNRVVSLTIVNLLFLLHYMIQMTKDYQIMGNPFSFTL